MKPKTIALLVVVALFVIVLVQNSDPTSVQVLFWDLINVPLFVLILSTIVLGWIMGWLTHMTYQKGKQKQPAKNQSPVEQKSTDKETEAEPPSESKN